MLPPGLRPHPAPPMGAQSRHPAPPPLGPARGPARQWELRAGAPPMPGPAQWGSGSAPGAGARSGRCRALRSHGTGGAASRRERCAAGTRAGAAPRRASGTCGNPSAKGSWAGREAAVGRAGFGPALFKAPGCAPGQQQREPLSRRDPAPPPGEGESPEPQHSASQSCKGAAHALLKFSHRQINMKIK